MYYHNSIYSRFFKHLTQMFCSHFANVWQFYFEQSYKQKISVFTPVDPKHLHYKKTHRKNCFEAKLCFYPKKNNYEGKNEHIFHVFLPWFIDDSTRHPPWPQCRTLMRLASMQVLLVAMVMSWVTGVSVRHMGRAHVSTPDDTQQADNSDSMCDNKIFTSITT